MVKMPYAYVYGKVEIDLIHKGIKTHRLRLWIEERPTTVEIDLIHKGIKTTLHKSPKGHTAGRRNRPDS